MGWVQHLAGPERRARRRCQALYLAITPLPVEVRRAMLSAIDVEPLIVGAYTDRSGRVCPALAAHRRGARTNVAAFAKAWDAFAGASRPRPASPRELDVLRAMLQESLAGATVTALAPQPVLAAV